MMDKILEILSVFNIHIIILSGLIAWYFSEKTRNSLEKKNDILEKNIQDINTRMSRLEVTTYGKDSHKA